MFRDFSLSAAYMGLLAAFVGFVSSFAIVLAGLNAMGATSQEAASGLMFSSISMGVCGLLFAIFTRAPAAVAWSTHGAALLASTAAMAGGFPEAVGGIIICCILIVITGIVPALMRLIESIPKPIASALLAGVIFKLCLAPALALGATPWLTLPILTAWVLGLRWSKLAALPMSVAAFAAILIYLAVSGDARPAADLPPVAMPQIITPVFSIQAAISIALPLYLVTMAGQNIPGFTVLKMHNYEAPQAKLLNGTGIASLLTAPLCAIPVNMSAVTAAMMAGEDAHRDPARRYWATIINGMAYIAFGIFAGALVSSVSIAPTLLVTAVAGLALLPALVGSAKAAFADADHLESSAATFVITASGMTLWSISGAFWGLVVGLIVWVTTRKQSSH